MKQKLLQLWSSWAVLWDTIGRSDLFYWFWSRAVLKIPVKEWQCPRWPRWSRTCSLCQLMPASFSVPHLLLFAFPLDRAPIIRSVAWKAQSAWWLPICHRSLPATCTFKTVGRGAESCGSHWAILNSFRKYNKRDRFYKCFTSFLFCEINRPWKISIWQRLLYNQKKQYLVIHPLQLFSNQFKC